LASAFAEEDASMSSAAHKALQDRKEPGSRGSLGLREPPRRIILIQLKETLEC